MTRRPRRGSWWFCGRCHSSKNSRRPSSAPGFSRCKLPRLERWKVCVPQYWGNSFFPPGPAPGQAAGALRAIPPLNQWQCWEFMIQANTAPGLADGKQAMWVDGKRLGEFTGIRWRNDLDLKVNCLWLEHYGYDEGDPTKAYWKERQSVWFDDIVVARQYIGPRVKP